LIGANGQTPNDNFTIPADRSLIPGAGDGQPLEVEAERGPVPDAPHSHFFMVRDFDLIPLRGVFAK
jgi:hypothetical protein